MCKALYPYDASDADELTFNEGDMLEFVSEGKCGVWCAGTKKNFSFLWT